MQRYSKSGLQLLARLGAAGPQATLQHTACLATAAGPDLAVPSMSLLTRHCYEAPWYTRLMSLPLSLPASLQEWIWWAVPKKKVSKHRRGLRNQNKWLRPVKQVSVCSDCGRVMHVMAIPTRCNKANCAAKMVPKDVLAEVESNDFRANLKLRFTVNLFQSEPSAPDESGPPLIAIGDVHGDLHNLLRALQLVQVVDAHGSWAGGRAVVVQTGDVVDRGRDGINATMLLSQLQLQAESAGGRLVMLLGNHEALQLMHDLRYVGPAELAQLAQPQHDRAACGGCDMSLHRSDPCWQRAACAAALDAGRVRLGEMLQLGASSAYGQTLRNKPLLALHGSGACATLFVHAGLPLTALAALVPEYASVSDPATLVKRANEAFQDVLLGCVDGEGCDTARARLLLQSKDSPIWYRGLALDAERHLCSNVQRVLALFGAARVVVGHTVMPWGRFKTRCGGAVHLIDVGMSAAYANTWAVWRCVGGRVFGHYAERVVEL